MRSLTSLAHTTIIISWLFVGLACLTTTALVMYRLKFLDRKVGFDDGCIFVALVLGILIVSQTTWAIVGEGFGEHQHELSSQETALVAKSLIIGETLWSFSMALIRIAACYLICTLFRPVTKTFFMSATTLFFCAVHGIGSIVELLLICRPLASQWDSSIQGDCGDQTASFLAIELSGLALDVVILVLPILGLSYISVDIRTKLLIICVLDAGIITFIITILRLKELRLAAASDFTYSKSYLGLLSAIGCMLSVIICSARLFRMLGHILKSRLIVFERKLELLDASKRQALIKELLTDLWRRKNRIRPTPLRIPGVDDRERL